MSIPLTGRLTLATSLILTAGFAQADVTPTQVWEEWVSQMEGFGYEIGSVETRLGNDLEISELELGMPLPEEEGEIVVSMPGFTFQDKGDGTVALQLPSTYPVQVHVVPANEGDEEVEVTLNYNTTGLSMVASGEPEAIAYNYSAASIGMALAELIVDGEAIDLGEISLTLVNVSGNSTTTGNMLKTAEQAFRSEQLLFNVDVNEPDGGEEYVKIGGKLDDLTFEGTSAMPKDMDPEDMAKALAQGFAFDGGFSHGGGESTFDIFADGDKMQGSSSSGSGEMRIAMDSEAVKLFLQTMDGKAMMQVPDLPFPVEYAIGESGMDIVIPVAMTDDQQDFKMAVKLADFTMADMLWGIFDPAGQLPRDPATIDIDLSGKVKVLANIFEPEQMDSMEAPGELHAIDINKVTVRAVGAELTGKGAFTFDNSDLISFDGMPRPEGMLDMALTGGNALLDKVVAMGFVSEEDAMGARMMVGMFTVPGDGEDSLKSTIEVNADGHVMANGMRLK